MALQDILSITEAKGHKKIGMSRERVDKIVPQMRQYIAFWRQYPDLFVDFMSTGGNPEVTSSFSLFFYQRVFLRIAMRYKYVYAVFPRAYSKSFLTVLVLLIRGILYPGARLFSTAGGKEQAAQILQEKVQDICKKIPAFKREIDWRRGKTQEGKDYCKYVLKSGSTIENVAAKESSRGRRMHAGVMEESVSINQQMLQEVIIPMMNVSRPCADGVTHEEEVLNQSQIFITTAGYKNTFSYDKLIQLLVLMVVEPGKAFVMGGTWRIPVLLGLQPKNFITDLRKDSTFNEASFGREYESRWTGNSEDAYFSSDLFDRGRVLVAPEYEYSSKASRSLSYYVISADIGRKGCQTEICVIKVTPQPRIGQSIKTLVNLMSLGDMHFEEQAATLKRLFYKYNAKRLVLDANGLGIGILDYMVTKTVDPQTGEEFPGFGVCNDSEKFYEKYYTPETQPDAIYALKANLTINTEAHVTTQMHLHSGRIKFLIDERMAKAKLLNTRAGTLMTPEQRAEYLQPYVLTSILKEQMLNFREVNEGTNIILKKANTHIPHDKFSALEYGLYYIKQEEDKIKKKKTFSFKDFMFRN